jgi:oligopeptidase B
MIDWDAAAAGYWAARAGLLEDVRRELRRTGTGTTRPSLPVRRGGFSYGREAGTGQYPVHVRWAPDGRKQVVLDENAIAGDGYLELGSYQLSPDSALVAYTADVTGDEHFEVHVRDIGRGEELPVRRAGAGPAVAWAASSDAVFYTRLDECGRPASVVRLPLRDDAGERVILAEPDERFDLDVALAKSGRWLFITSVGPDCGKVSAMPADQAEASPAPLLPGEEGQTCYAVHAAGPEVFVLSTAGDRSWVTAVRPGEPRSARRVAQCEGDGRIEEIDAAGHFLIMRELHGSVQRLRVTDTRSGQVRTYSPPVPQSQVTLGANPEPRARRYRFSYSSLAVPRTFADYVLATGRTTTVRTQAPDGYRAADYAEERLWATSADGTKVPIAVVRRRDVPADGTAPGLLVAYASYGLDVSLDFLPFRQVLLDRGFVFAIGYPRGGGALGPRWHDAGRRRDKRNGVADLIACAEHLTSCGLVAPSRLTGRGFSAAGVLFGAAINQRPELFAAIALHAPLVDVMAGLVHADDSAVVSERLEWGDPSDPADALCILGYSPAHNIRRQPYPAVWVTASTDDPRIRWRDVAAWAERLRAASTSGRPVHLRLTGGGHAGPSGTEAASFELAMTLAFLCDQVACSPADAAPAPSTPATSTPATSTPAAGQAARL